MCDPYVGYATKLDTALMESNSSHLCHTNIPLQDGLLTELQNFD